MHFEKFERHEKEEIKMTKSSNVEISENNVITSINGVSVEEMNEKEKQKEIKEQEGAKKHKFEDDMLNYNILFMLIGLGLGMIFGKLFTSNIAIAMCVGTLLGLGIGIAYTEYLIKKHKEKNNDK